MKTSSTTLWTRFKTGCVRIRGAWRDPALRRLWLRNTRRLQFVFGAIVLAGVFALPPAAEAIGDAVFPPKKVGSFFRKRTKRQPASETLALSLTALFWIGGIVGSAKKAYQKLPSGETSESKSIPVPQSNSGGSSVSEEAFLQTLAQSDEDIALDETSHSSSASGAVAEGKTVSAPVIAKNRYVIGGELGRGGMGIVYEAQDSVLGRAVALKSLAFSPGDMETIASRFRLEARVLASLTHPNIVQIYDLIETEEGIYIAMELVRGMNLADYLKEQGPLPPKKAVELFLPLAQAMAYAHDQGVLHRDFKPHNILLTKDLLPKITDFGLAKAEQAPHLTKTGALMGSPTYMSPEQGSGKELGPQSDVYSFGITLFEILSGRPPFTGGFLKIALAKASQPPPPLKEFAPDVPEELDRLIAQMLVSEPQQRISSMRSVADRLRAVS